MRLFKRLMVRLRRRWNPERTAGELDEELRFHIDMEARDLMRRGVPPAEARRRAEREFGNYERFKQGARDAGALPRLEGLLIDVRHALRQMRLQPGFALVAVLTLALGLGAATAIYSVVHAVLLRPLPYAEPGELVVLTEYPRERGVPDPGSRSGVAYLNFVDWRESPASAEVFDGMALSGSTSYLLLDAGEPRGVRAHLVTDNYFRLLGVPAALGRTIEPGDPASSVVLSDRLWRESFDADPGVLGETLRLDGEPLVVIGVMPGWFEEFGSARLWAPLTDDNHPLLQRRDFRAYRAIGRLADGVTVARAQAAMEAMRDVLADAHPEDNEAWSVIVWPLYDDIVGPVRATLLLLFAAVGLLLLLAGANVANLLLARTTSRRRETAMRAALGAGRARIVQQLLVESVVLALCGGVAGLLIGVWGARIIVALTPSDIPRLGEPGAGAEVVLFALGAALVSGLLLGLAPVVKSRAAGVMGALRRASFAGDSAARHTKRLRAALVVAEVALSLLLLIAAGLLISSFAYLWGYDAGFEADNVLTMTIVPVGARYPEEAHQAAFYQELYDRLRRIPQIEAVGGNTRIPLGSGNIMSTIEGQGSSRDESSLPVNLRPISGDYFDVLRIPVLAGRGFRDGDGDAVIVNELAARELWPDEPPVAAVGRMVRFVQRNGVGDWMPVIGVVGATRHGGLDPDPRPEIYQPHARRSFGVNVVVMRTRGDPLDVAEIVRQAVYAIDPEQPVGEVRSMVQVIADSMRRPRFYASLFATFGALALLIATAGVFAMAMYATSRRRREIGVRMAVGARARDVVSMIVREGLALVTLGVALGLVAALALRRYLADLLYGVSTSDPASIAAAVAVLTGAALLGFWLPARRAARLDPTEALRME